MIGLIARADRAGGPVFAGEQFGCGQMVLPDLLASAEAMKAAAPDLSTELAQQALANGFDPLEAMNRGFCSGTKVFYNGLDGSVR